MGLSRQLFRMGVGDIGKSGQWAKMGLKGMQLSSCKITLYKYKESLNRKGLLLQLRGDSYDLLCIL